MSNRIDIKRILKNDKDRRELFSRVIKSIQNREGINTTLDQAKNAYDKIRIENESTRR